MSRPPSQAVIEAVQQAEREHLSRWFMAGGSLDHPLTRHPTSDDTNPMTHHNRKDHPMNTTHQPQQPPTRDDYGQIAPESARPATLTPEQPVKAPGQDGDIFLKRGKPVEVEWPRGSRLLCYVDEGGYQYIAGEVGNGNPYPWGVVRIVRVFADVTPPKPDLPRQIKPEDVRVGMIIEQRKGVCIMRGRVVAVEDGVFQCEVAWLRTENERDDWSLWLIEDAPAPVDPDGTRHFWLNKPLSWEEPS